MFVSKLHQNVLQDVQVDSLLALLKPQNISSCGITRPVKITSQERLLQQNLSRLSFRSHEIFPSLPLKGFVVALCFPFDFVWHSHSDALAAEATGKGIGTTDTPFGGTI